MILLKIIQSDTTSVFSAIAKTSQQTADNTALGPYDFWTILIAVLALSVSAASFYIAKKTLESQQKTEKNTSRLSKESVVKVLEHVFERAYVNYVRSCVILHKLQKGEYRSYPSRDQVSYMKLPLEYVIMDGCNELSEAKLIGLVKLQSSMASYNERLAYRFGVFENAQLPVDIKSREANRLHVESVFMMVLVDKTMKQINDYVDLEVPSPDTLAVTERRSKELIQDAQPDTAQIKVEDVDKNLLLNAVERLYGSNDWKDGVEALIKNNISVMSGQNKRNEDFVLMIPF